MKDYYIGIDNGVNGGIVVLDKDQNVISKHVMPVLGKSTKEYDINTIRHLLNRYNANSFAVLEKAQAQFRDGKKQAFKTGFGYGVMQALLIAENIPHQIIAPKIWQKKVFEGLPADDTKTASIMFCKRKWPNEDWTPTERSQKCHDGLTDAACMAYYGVQLNE